MLGNAGLGTYDYEWNTVQSLCSDRKNSETDSDLYWVDCEKPRVIYSATKVGGQENAILTKILGLYQYSCGSELQELF